MNKLFVVVISAAVISCGHKKEPANFSAPGSEKYPKTQVLQTWQERLYF